jgi:hypothetical protein
MDGKNIFDRVREREILKSYPVGNIFQKKTNEHIENFPIR